MRLDPVLALSTVLLLMVLLVALLSFLVYRGQNSATKLVKQTLSALLLEQVEENQRLRNLLLSKDPMTVHALQAVSSSNNEEEFVPGEDIAYAQRLRDAGVDLTEVPDEFVAAGWTAEPSGTPVTFGQTGSA